jgi:O-antigen ligase
MIWLMIGYMFIFIHRPYEVWTIFDSLRPELVYMLLTGLVWLITPKRWVLNWHNVALALLTLATFFCWQISPWSGHGDVTIDRWWKMLVFYLLLITVVKDEAQLRLLVTAFLVIMFLYLTHSLREYVGGRFVFRMGIARLIGVDKYMNDPNSFGATIVYSLAMVKPLWVTARRNGLRIFLAAYVSLATVCVGLTGSRGSFLGLLFWVFLMVWRSRYRGAMFVLVLCMAPILWMALPPSLQNRFETIVNPAAANSGAKASAEGRLHNFLLGIQLWSQNPVAGVGPGAWRTATGSETEPHNLYAQVIGETGTIGVGTFLLLLLTFWWNWRRVRQMARQRPDLAPSFSAQLASGVGVGVLLLLFLGNSGHNLYRYNWVWYGGWLVLARHFLEARMKASLPTLFRPALAGAPQPWPGLWLPGARPVAAGPRLVAPAKPMLRV